ncbi:MAG: hypothetical protein AAF514_08570, partial [Verrucomicrobiota bacterium]
MKFFTSFFVAIALLAVPAWAGQVANSVEDWSPDGTQGNNGWFYGYRNLSADDGEDNYDPGEDFIQFEDDWWNGTGYDEPNADGDNVPWTLLNADSTHPNGTNNGEEHWTIRRWAATVNFPTPLAFSWTMAKQNTNCGNGVGGGIYLNGEAVDVSAVEGDDGIGIEQTFYINVNPGDLIDLVLTPRGPDETAGDGCDGSFNRLNIDDTIPPNPVQPDGSDFIPLTGEDSDGDGLPDAWEEIFFPGDLTKLGAGDFDNDGSDDGNELLLASDPTKEDTDEDGLRDGVETKTGQFVSAEDTGTDPNNADSDGDTLPDGFELTTTVTDPTNPDTDGDSFTDGEEFNQGFDPRDGASNPNNTKIADSIEEWSLDGNQGENGWTYGYRNVTADPSGEPDYNPAEDFIEFEETWWTGVQYDSPNGDVPWTFIGTEGTHPNGDNNGAIHWTIRRYEVTFGDDQVKPVAIQWTTKKTNTNGGNGVTGAVHLNGVRIDSAAIEGVDGDGVDRTVYANVKTGDLIDLILSPKGPNGSNADGSDGSANSMSLNLSIPDNPLQPNGDLFIPATAGDTDNDNLPDPWELSFFPGDLTQLSGEMDFDNDGLSDRGEFDLMADPTKTDTDGDSLTDGVETGTLVFIDANDTGTSPVAEDTDGDTLSDADEISGDPQTDPTKSDTDDDGFSDAEELASGTDPNDPALNPFTGVIAFSEDGFSEEQGRDGWFLGYRNVENEEVDYDPADDFIQYPEDWWNGTTWDFPDGDVPWTFHSATTTHPNGDNNGELHWSIRRWEAQVDDVTPVAIQWHTAKQNVNCGNGVTGAIHLNGVRLDGEAIESNDGEGITRVVYANVEPGDAIDLINSPMGPDEGNADGCDGSSNWFTVSTILPDDPIQPDGTPFIPETKDEPNIRVPRGQVFGLLGDSPGIQERVLEIRNTGEIEMLNLASFTLTGPDVSHYTIGETPTQLAPGESAEVGVIFDPKGRSGGFIAMLEVASDDPGNPVRSIDLTARIPDPFQLIAHYKLDETDGDEVLDSSGGGANGIITLNGGEVTTGEAAVSAGTSFALSGSEAGAGYVEIPARSFDPFGDFTISLWLNADSVSGTSALFSKGATEGSPGDPFALAIAEGGLVWLSGTVQDFIIGDAIQVGED